MNMNKARVTMALGRVQSSTELDRKVAATVRVKVIHLQIKKILHPRTKAIRHLWLKEIIHLQMREMHHLLHLFRGFPTVKTA